MKWQRIIYSTIGLCLFVNFSSAGYAVDSFPKAPLFWAKQVGATGGLTDGRHNAMDGVGNSYVAGVTNVGISGQRQNGQQDYFITQYDEFGNLQWTRQVGADNGVTEANGISVSTAGNSYVVGNTTVGLSGQKQNGARDYFVASYDASGMLQWSRQVGAGTGNTYGIGIDSDNAGNSYVTGTTTIGISGQPQKGLYDYFIAKYDASGNLRWVRQLGAAGGSTAGRSVSVDQAGNSYITGYTTVGIAGQQQKGHYDYFIAKYDAAGNLQWVRQMGGDGGETLGAAIKVDDAGNSYVTGATNISLANQPQNGDNDYYIARYNTTGALQWLRQVGAVNGGTFGMSVDIDDAENSYVTGYTSVAIAGQKQNGIQDCFVVKHGASGVLQSARQIGASGGKTIGYSINADRAGNGYSLTGNTNTGIFGQRQNGLNDYFIVYIPNGI